MRWQFTEGGSPEERDERNAVIDKIDCWWDAFDKDKGEIARVFKNASSLDLPQWMNDYLHTIDPRLMWEFGPALHGDGHRLVITPESDHYLRPLAQAILSRKPELPGWEFYEHRLPESVELARHTIEGRVRVQVPEVSLTASVGEHNRIDITYYSPTFSGPDDKTAFNIAFVLTETLLGEDILNNWIGRIEVDKLPKQGWLSKLSKSEQKKPHMIPLENSLPTVNAVIESIKNQLPDQPAYAWAQSAGWTLYELQPREQPDYIEQTDMFVGKSCCKLMWVATRQCSYFTSQRFSRFNEVFCYLKIDGSQGLDGEKFADKSDIEDAMSEALEPAKLGAVIGGGTGKRYSYIDLAIPDLARAIPVIQQVMRNGNINRRSWIQFYDTDWAHEWIGIYEDSPEPPLPSFDS